MDGPRSLARLAARLRALVRGRAIDSELDEELRFHVEHLIADGVARGLTPEARRPGIKPHIVSGQDEARFSGYGVICGMPDAAGVMGDLGGGSLTAATLANPLVVISLSMIIGAVFGYVSEKVAGMLVGSASRAAAKA